MVRPKKKRKVNFQPQAVYFKPRGRPLAQLKEVRLNIDEIEAIRLCDKVGLSQTKAAEKMHVSQSTLRRILVSARQKVAQALTEGRAVRIEKDY